MNSPVVYLLDVDNTLLDNDRVVADLMRHLDRTVGHDDQQQYWSIFDRLRAQLGYADYLGALQLYRAERPHDLSILQASSFLINYPFANRLFPNSLDVIERLNAWGPTVILSDGDIVFQPRKIERSGLWEAVDGRVLIYVHKEAELEDVERRFPADHYVMLAEFEPEIPQRLQHRLDERFFALFDCAVEHDEQINIRVEAERPTSISADRAHGNRKGGAIAGDLDNRLHYAVHLIGIAQGRFPAGTSASRFPNVLFPCRRQAGGSALLQLGSIGLTGHRFVITPHTRSREPLRRLAPFAWLASLRSLASSFA